MTYTCLLHMKIGGFASTCNTYTHTEAHNTHAETITDQHRYTCTNEHMNTHLHTCTTHTHLHQDNYHTLSFRQPCQQSNQAYRYTHLHIIPTCIYAQKRRPQLNTHTQVYTYTHVQMIYTCTKTHAHFHIHNYHISSFR